jgi:hypothetical protein
MWTPEAIRTFLLEGHIAGLHLGADESTIPASLGEPEEGNTGRGMRRSGLRLRRYLGALEVTTLRGSIVMIQLNLEHPPCAPEELPRRLMETYGVEGVMEREGCRVSEFVTVQWHGEALGIAARRS